MNDRLFIRGRVVVVAAVALTGFALTACGASQEPTSDAAEPATESTAESAGDAQPAGELRNGPIPQDHPRDAWEEAADLPAEPDGSAPVAEQISHTLLIELAEFAHHYDESATVDCPDVELGKKSDITCEATYFAQSLTWEVAISAGTTFAGYDPVSPDRVVSRQFIEDSLRYESKSEDVGCPMEEYQLVQPEAGLELECESLTDGEAVNWELSLSAYGDATFYRL